ncbi:cyclic 2,3-diphosphoglycerate synthase [Falsiroseomonas oryzae]|uniref:cyclic 2,3-diphosphoglycerate synthase n=1 Tax=Falsiroseomonas oryzae TaxID=2766473 RepID=UPI0022EAF40F|nr:cyclic 2,3-diphosphoglycerate synthase [Roseomonas sp. MO-31]
MNPRQRVLILGAAGRDFHDFNLVYRDDPTQEVVAFTAAQIPGIAGRRYPPELAGPLYPAGIPILDEAELPSLLRRGLDSVVFAYSDVSQAHVMRIASSVLAGGAEFVLPGPRRTMLASRLPVIAVCAVRTGCGKSQTARWLAARLRARGLRVGILRHPMPYGDLARQVVQRFASVAEMDAAGCTVEEREEYEPHVAAGGVVHVGVDTALVLARAEAESDIILWDGGNNDFPFIRPDLLIVLADALRPGHVEGWHPGEAVLRSADIVLVAKANAAPAGQVAQVMAAARRLNPSAILLRAGTRVTLEDAAAVRGRRVLVVEDGPTLTHGGMPHGAGHAAARAAGAAEILDPRPSAAPAIATVYAAFPHLGPVLPAMGYDAAQLRDLGETIARSGADLVVSATPADLARLIAPGLPIIRARYDYEEIDTPGLGEQVDAFSARHASRSAGTAQ